MSIAILFLVDLLPSLDGGQSALDPRGASAEAIARLSWVMIISGTLIFVAVMALVAYASWGGELRECNDV